MPCQHVKIDGVSAIVCGPRTRRRKCACGRPSSRLCDWKIRGKKSGTCDKPLCDRCARQPAPEKDLCPEHAAEWDKRCFRGPA